MILSGPFPRLHFAQQFPPSTDRTVVNLCCSPPPPLLPSRCWPRTRNQLDPLYIFFKKKINTHVMPAAFHANVILAGLWGSGRREFVWGCECLDKEGQLLCKKRSRSINSTCTQQPRSSDPPSSASRDVPSTPFYLYVSSQQ